MDGKKHGKGLCIYATGYRYKGEYRNNQPNGRGVMLFPNGMRQEGIWVNGAWIGS
ncbi:hypothetical protein ICL16_12425 [Iningainema sp. BLCCT55]|uniref:MORN repeat-containing protein n=1 Tax=Iningainema tapete BLCC-T55 TaxID=2748662 RepID=A0A8J6XIA9_9CYAN|nr:hypothetical protein [Iningainema tapete BLCC-T55]